MTEHESLGREVREHYEGAWSGGDPWEVESPEFEQAKAARQLALLRGRRYARVLEIGCGNGHFTGLLAGIADQVVALDVAPSAIELARARAAGAGPGVISFRAANIMDYDLRAEGPWDLVVMMEMIYEVGCFYPFFNVAWLAAELLAATRGGGRLLLTNTYGPREYSDWVTRPWVINTYRDLFRNVGYRLEAEEIFGGGPYGVDIQILISLFEKVPGGPTGDAG